VQSVASVWQTQYGEPQDVIFDEGAVMEEQKPLGIFSWIIIVFLLLVVLGVMGGTFFPDSFLGQPL
jgi:heme/copper-type cytochrome/quinol oxidase subunit 2